MYLSTKVNTVRTWLRNQKNSVRRTDMPNADELWNYIRKRFPNDDEAVHEEIFQAVDYA